MDVPNSKLFEIPSLESIKDWLKIAAKSIALAAIIGPFIGGLFVLRFGITIGHLPRARWESLLPDLFAISLFGMALGVMMVTLFMGCPGWWRWAHREETPETLHPRAMLFTFLASQLSLGVMIIVFALWEYFRGPVPAQVQPITVTVWSAIFALALPLLTAPKDRWKNWWPNFKRSAASSTLMNGFLCALTAAMVMGIVVTQLMEFDDGWQIFVGMIGFSVFYSVYADNLAAPKGNRHTEIRNWVGGGLISLVIVLVWFGDKLSAAALHNLGYANLTGVVLHVDDEGKRILISQKFVSTGDIEPLPPVPDAKNGETLYLVKGVDAVTAFGDPYVLKKHDGSRKVRHCRFSAASSGNATLDQKDVRCLLLAATHVRSIGSDEGVPTNTSGSPPVVKTK
jgi:hypothetical protein